eukprot:GEMP01071004.1.p1 GENE.GEMP01071004.1~~GEMP01071004.1.p1  ORF type:complete len:140 (-),score=18.14 GEMP01071004.1:72-491(-)
MYVRCWTKIYQSRSHSNSQRSLFRIFHPTSHILVLPLIFPLSIHSSAKSSNRASDITFRPPRFLVGFLGAGGIVAFVHCSSAFALVLLPRCSFTLLALDFTFLDFLRIPEVLLSDFLDRAILPLGADSVDSEEPRIANG